jgi:hypothetical protein
MPITSILGGGLILALIAYLALNDIIRAFRNRHYHSR